MFSFEIDAEKILKFITSIDTVVVIPFDGVKICQEPEFVYENWVSIMCGFDEMSGLRYTPLTPV